MEINSGVLKMFMNSLFGENLFDDFFENFEAPARRAFGNAALPTRNNLMSTDVREKDGSFDLDIELPGFKKEDVKAELKDGYLTVSAVRKSETEDKKEDGKYLRRERFYGSCSRSFFVGPSVTENDITARFEDGILKLSVPKKTPEIPQPKYIAIEG